MNKSAADHLSDNIAWLLANTTLDSQKKIAEAAGVDQKTVSRMLNKLHAPTTETLSALADKLRLETWQLLAPNFGGGLHRVQGERVVHVAEPKVELRKRPIKAAA